METEYYNCGRAIEELKRTIRDIIETAIEEGDDIVGEEVADLVDMIRTIKEEGWQVVAIAECDFAPSGLTVYEMVKKGDQ